MWVTLVSGAGDKSQHEVSSLCILSRPSAIESSPIPGPFQSYLIPCSPVPTVLTVALVAPVCLGFVVFTDLKYNFFLVEVMYTTFTGSGGCVGFGWFNFLEGTEKIS